MAGRWMHAAVVMSISVLAVTFPGQAVPVLVGVRPGPARPAPAGNHMARTHVVGSRPAGHGPAASGRCSAGRRERNGAPDRRRRARHHERQR